MRILKKAASEATIDVQPVPESTTGHDGGWGLLTKPFGKASTEGQGGINPSVGIVNVVTRGWKGDGHFGERLKDSPDACADQKVSNNHVSRATTGQSRAGTDEQPRANVGPKGNYLEVRLSAGRHAGITG